MPPVFVSLGTLVEHWRLVQPPMFREQSLVRLLLRATKRFQERLTSLGPIRSKRDLIELWVIPDQGTVYMQKFMLSSEQDLLMLKEVLSMWDVMIDEDALRKLRRAGLAHLLYEAQDLPELYTPRQLELNFMTLHNAEEKA